jgi:hypothetical protein
VLPGVEGLVGLDILVELVNESCSLAVGCHLINKLIKLIHSLSLVLNEPLHEAIHGVIILLKSQLRQLVAVLVVLLLKSKSIGPHIHWSAPLAGVKLGDGLDNSELISHIDEVIELDGMLSLLLRLLLEE